MKPQYMLKTGDYYIMATGGYTLKQRYALRFSLDTLPRFINPDACLFFGNVDGDENERTQRPMRIVRLVKRDSRTLGERVGLPTDADWSR